MAAGSWTAKLQAGKRVWHDGRLSLSATSLAWAPLADGASAFRVALSGFKATPKKSKSPATMVKLEASRSMILKFGKEADRDAFVEALCPLLPQLRAQAPPFPQVQPPHAEEKRALLVKDKGLGDLYTQLIGTGAVTDGEFWASKGHLLGVVRGKAQAQKRGAATSMLLLTLQEQIDRFEADRAEAQDGRGASFNFHLDNETRQQILAEKPKVLQSFQAMVPKEMAENEFWGKYCSYLYRKSIKARGKGAAKATTAKDIAAAEEDARNETIFEERREEREAQRRAMVSRAQHVNAGVNLAADGHDGLAPGYGVHHDGGRESAAVVAGAGKIQHVIVDNVLSGINRHSSMVVGPAAAGAGEGPGEAPDVEIQDLELPQAWRYSELKIQNPRGYFAGPGSANGAHLLDASALGAALGSAGAGGGDFLAAGQALKVIEDLAQKVQVGRTTAAQAAAQGPGGGAIRGAGPAELVGKYKILNELLRHFWAAFPLTPARKDKAERLTKALGKLYDDLQELKNVDDHRERQVRTGIIKPMQAVIDAAFDRFRAETQDA